MEFRGQLRPGTTYYRGSSLGEGAFGTVCRVFDDCGDSYAMKLFEPTDDGTIDPGSIVELALLRTFTHRCVATAHDIVSTERLELGVIMEEYPLSLAQAIAQRGDLLRSKKVRTSYLLLCGLTHIHDHGFIHRDVKSDNIMLRSDLTPVFIDFSIATRHVVNAPNSKKTVRTRRHTGNVGTTPYIAPEVYWKKPYTTLADIWSLGVVLLELCRGKAIPDDSDRRAFQCIRAAKCRMPTDKPWPDLIRRMLEENTAVRPSGRMALVDPLFARWNGGCAPKKVSIKAASSFVEQPPPSVDDSTSILLRRLYRNLECTEPKTLRLATRLVAAAKNNRTSLRRQPPSYLHCFLLAMKLCEPECYDLEDPDDWAAVLEPTRTPPFDLEQYRYDEHYLLQATRYHGPVR